MGKNYITGLALFNPTEREEKRKSDIEFWHPSLYALRKLTCTADRTATFSCSSHAGTRSSAIQKGLAWPAGMHEPH